MGSEVMTLSGRGSDPGAALRHAATLTRPRRIPKLGKPGAWQAMILLIDNYDSFTFNLVHFLGELGA